MNIFRGSIVNEWKFLCVHSSILWTQLKMLINQLKQLRGYTSQFLNFHWFLCGFCLNIEHINSLVINKLFNFLLLYYLLIIVFFIYLISQTEITKNIKIFSKGRSRTLRWEGQQARTGGRISGGEQLLKFSSKLANYWNI